MKLADVLAMLDTLPATNNEDALQHRLWMVAKRVSGAVG